MTCRGNHAPYQYHHQASKTVSFVIGAQIAIAVDFATTWPVWFSRAVRSVKSDGVP